MVEYNSNADMKYIHCPNCLATCELPVAFDLPEASCPCPVCKTRFPVQDAKSAPPPEAASEEAENQEGVALLYGLFFVVALVTTYGCGELWQMGPEISGVRFVMYYLTMIITLIAGQWIVRAMILDTWVVRITASCIALSVSVVRVLSLQGTGMDNFGFLVLLTFAGVFLPFMTWTSDGRSYGHAGSVGGGCGGCSS